MSSAVEVGDLQFLDWLHSHEASSDDTLLSYSPGRKVTQWLLSHGCSTDHLYDTLVKNNDVESVKDFIANGIITQDSINFDKAIRSLEMAKLLKKSNIFPPQSRMLLLIDIDDI